MNLIKAQVCDNTRCFKEVCLRIPLPVSQSSSAYVFGFFDHVICLQGTDPEENHSEQQRRRPWYVTDEEGEHNEPLQPLLTTQVFDNEPYSHTPTNQYHQCGCAVVKPRMTAERPDSPPPAYTTELSNASGLNPHSEFPQECPNNVEPTPSN